MCAIINISLRGGDIMKEMLKAIGELILILISLIGFGLIALYLGMKVPYQLWSDGDWGFAIAQAVIVWSWLLGGKRK